MDKKLSRNFTIPASFEDVDRLSKDVSDEIASICGHDVAFKLAVCITEACSNVIKHGYKHDRSKEITIRIRVSDGAVSLIIEDLARYFNPLDAESPDLSSVTDLQKGGMGILMIRKMARDISYERKGNKNILTILL
ncbi:MAG: Putative anti-sigma regulatory factor, serine/threonine protein kinase [Thermotogales bacterium 46_20]|nr:MAG: Putative anti-sigma regulatory factor, serine/threonine protein kinase [Thermotogales bacterium 46_20]